MPLPGGEADKIGNRYEIRWTIHCLIEILNEQADSIRLEPPGEEGKGVEFWIRKGSKTEYHQVKRQNTQGGRWTNADLERQRVLTNFYKKLQSDNITCVFVSTHAAFELEELSERAKKATSFDEFKQDYLGGNWKSVFSELCVLWGNISENLCFETLKQIRVETISESSLSNFLNSFLSVLVEGASSLVQSVLAQFIEDKVGFELSAHDIWQHLESKKLYRRQWDKDQRILTLVESVNEVYLSLLRDANIDGHSIPRDETCSIVEKLDNKKNILVSGEAGIGKSVVLFQVIQSIREKGWPFLAFRVDRLEPALLPEKLGTEQLNLPGSPANVLAAIALDKDCLLIIDQLDAVSSVSGRNPQFFDCIHAIIQQALVFPKMRVLIACRKFDLKNDYRFRKLTKQHGIAEEIQTQHLRQDTVKEVVSQVGLDSNKLTERQLRLLSIPINLHLLAEVIESNKLVGLNFRTTKDLFDIFWDHKQQKIRERLGHSIKWNPIINSLCGYMNDQEVLSVPTSVIEQIDCVDDAKVMASEHVLIHAENRFLFFHESFFDYAFARRFGGQEITLIEFLLQNEQFLFRRAQIRQILIHKRDINAPIFSRYLSDVAALLNNNDIRPHIKDVVFALLASLEDPQESEWQILEKLLQNINVPLYWKAWSVFHGSIHWFQLLRSLGVIHKWLECEDEPVINRTIRFLSSIQKHLADDVAELIEPYISKSEEWNHRCVHIMQWGDLDAGRKYFELFLRSVSLGLFDEINGPNKDFWSFAYDLADKKPDWMSELVGQYLKRQASIQHANTQSGRFHGNIHESPFTEEKIRLCAGNAPLEYILHVFPPFLELISLSILNNGEELIKEDSFWVYRGYSIGFESLLLSSLEIAFTKISVTNPNFFSQLVETIRPVKYKTIQFLILRGYSANGERFANKAISYIIKIPELLKVELWTTKRLIETTTPYCSDTLLAELEKMLLKYCPKSERGNKRWGYTQYILLNAVISSRRSDEVAKRIRELDRKFDKKVSQTEKILNPVLEAIPSPIPSEAASKMTDEHWLKAVAKYNQDEMIHRNNRLIGGADKLAGVLREQVKILPNRFAKLLLKFPYDTHRTYIHAVLYGLTGIKLEVESLKEVCEYCHNFPNKPFGRQISELLEKSGENTLPEEIYEILVWYATEDPDPRPDEQSVIIQGEKADSAQNIFTNGINSVRGSAIETITHFLFENKNLFPYFLPTIEKTIHDPSKAVRSCVAETLVAMLNYDRGYAVRLFFELSKEEIALLSTSPAERFLHYAVFSHFQELQPLLEKMYCSDNQEVAVVGARQICVASLTNETAVPLAKICVLGNETQQIGAAGVFANNLSKARFDGFCEEALENLFNSPFEKAQFEASRCFDNLKENEIGNYSELIEKYIYSKAFSKHYFGLLRKLDESTSMLPEIILPVCERFLDIAGSNVADISTRVAGDSDIISKLLVRVYSQHDQNIDFRTKCLNLIDKMTLMGAYGLNRALAIYDR